MPKIANNSRQTVKKIIPKPNRISPVGKFLSDMSKEKSRQERMILKPTKKAKSIIEKKEMSSDR